MFALSSFYEVRYATVAFKYFLCIERHDENEELANLTENPS